MAKEMNYSSSRLASEDFIPHEAVVKKLKKYAGRNYSQASGKIYKGNPLSLLQYARAEMDGKNQLIYKFKKEHYDECARLEVNYQKKQQKASRDRILENPIAPKKKKK